MPKPRYIKTSKGVLSLREAANAFGISKNTIIGRMHRGWSEHRLCLPNVDTKVKTRQKQKTRTTNGFHKGFITPWGRKSVSQIAKILNLTYSGLISRLYLRKWTQEEAFNTPAYCRRHTAYVMPPDEYRRHVAQVAEEEKNRARSHAMRLHPPG